MTISVVKRDGRKEPLDLDKIHKVLFWAEDGLKNVSTSEVEMRSQIQLADGVTTEEIHELLIKSAADLISENTPDYQYMAAKLALFHLRKRAYGEYQPPHLHDHVKKLVNIGKYDKELLEDFSDEDFQKMDSWIDHSRDLEYTYSAIKQFEKKYLVQNKKTGEIYETPQFAYMLIGACLFSKEQDKKKRMKLIRSFYNLTSSKLISLPTPIMAGVRTPTRQFSSCVLIESGDSLKSINATSAAIVEYVSRRAGIGINGGGIRAEGSSIRNGEAVHTGCVPFFKHFYTAIASCSQGGVRKGSATLYYPFWHLEVENFLVLKNNKGVEENRIRHLDYGIQLNGFLFERLQKGQDVTLFSPNEVPDLYDAFFADQKKFRELYVKYEQDSTKMKKTIPAFDLVSLFLQERGNTGRIYPFFVDHANNHSSFITHAAPIRQSNLCLEITLPTSPLQSESEGEIALCTLAAFNLGEIDDLDDLEEAAYIIVRALDNLLDYQDYPMLAAEIGSKARRSLGVGVTNYAYYLAKNGVKYSDGSANDLTHRTFEAIQYYLLKASNKLAKEKGHCDWFNQTKYSQGILPIDTYKKTVDKLISEDLHYDWEELRQEIVESGLRNSTLTALMPCETSSVITNSTNGIEPPRSFVTIKENKDGVFPQVVPEYQRLKNQYELLWTMPNNKGYLDLVGIMQKFVDQAISSNTNYDPAKFENGKVPMSVMIKDLSYAWNIGLKTLYYHNTRDGAGKSANDDVALPSAADVMTEDDDCESCKI